MGPKNDGCCKLVVPIWRWPLDHVLTVRVKISTNFATLMNEKMILWLQYTALLYQSKNWGKASVKIMKNTRDVIYESSFTIFSPLKIILERKWMTDVEDDRKGFLILDEENDKLGQGLLFLWSGVGCFIICLFRIFY